jgi:hypothetical protein
MPPVAHHTEDAEVKTFGPAPCPETSVVDRNGVSCSPFYQVGANGGRYDTALPVNSGRLVLGGYPGLKPSRARDDAADARNRIRKGADPPPNGVARRLRQRTPLARRLGSDLRGHDLRRTAATRMAAAGVPREHIARVLNHVEGGARATRVYDRHTYDGEKRAALESWARSLAKVLAGKRIARPGHPACPSLNGSSTA